jgi:hypothetical protein
MEFSRSLVDVLVPKNLPPVFPDSVNSYIYPLPFPESLDFRSFVWANAIGDAYLSQGLPLKVLHFSAGFVYIPEYLHSDLPGVTIESSFAFGGYLLVPGNIGEIRVETVRIRDYTFPIIIHFGSIQLHSEVPYPSGGTSTCWVKSTSRVATWNNGILTCRHNVSSLGIGSTLSLTPTSRYSKPTSGTIAGMDECTVDAAIMEISNADFPKRVSRIPVATWISPGNSIEFDGLSSGLQTGTILRIHQMKNYFGNLYGQRIVIDCYGTYGDSGAFVKTTSPKEAVGIYMGSIPDGKGGDEGLCQCLLQVRDLFNVDFYI